MEKQATQDQGSFSLAVTEVASNTAVLRDTPDGRPVTWEMTHPDTMRLDHSQVATPVQMPSVLPLPLTLGLL